MRMGWWVPSQVGDYVTVTVTQIDQCVAVDHLLCCATTAQPTPAAHCIHRTHIVYACM
jgi:hypothetical protein